MLKYDFNQGAANITSAHPQQILMLVEQFFSPPARLGLCAHCRSVTLQ